MVQVSRNSSLKIPKSINVYEKNPNSVQDRVEVNKAIKTSLNEKYNKEEIESNAKIEDDSLNVIKKIPNNSNDLIVITIVKKLCAYVITVTEKSPKKFRGVFVNRMQNYCLDAIECLLEANFIRMDSFDNKKKRENLQRSAIVKLKLLGYISMIAETSSCILLKQYKQISMQVAEAINLTIAWKKSDDERYKKRVLG